MNLAFLSSRSDLIGTAASTLCLIHCLATPFLFILPTAFAGHGEGFPLWWGVLDLVFLVISFFAVWWSGKTTSRAWIRTSLWVCWAALTFIILNEKLEALPLSEAAIYIPSLGLIGLHLYNRKYCQCADEIA